MKREIDDNKERVGRLKHVMGVVNDVNHEINSPLTTIIAESQLMLMDADELKGEHRQSVETIERMSRRIRDLLQQLHELSLG
jgi:signal transduction histidine kinase